MSIRIGLNGFGRIGRTIFRASLAAKNSDMEIVHINDLTKPETLAHLLKYDSVHGKLDHDVISNETHLSIAGRNVSISSCKDPAEIPWKDMNVDIVFECTGLFRDRESTMRHINAGAPKF